MQREREISEVLQNTRSELTHLTLLIIRTQGIVLDLECSSHEAHFEKRFLKVPFQQCNMTPRMISAAKCQVQCLQINIALKALMRIR